jgi:septal ring factor EnvC (AmiA/AmiB activator)
MLDGVALEWAETARDLVRAAVVERESFAVNQVANELKTKIERERTLLEETQARRGRLAAELARLQAEAAEATKQARNIEAERLRGAQKGGKPDRPPVEKHKSAGGAGGD